MYTIKEIQDFVAKQIGVNTNEVTPDCEIYKDLACYGDDFHDFIEAYSTTFNVEMRKYLWYFHTPEEGNSSIGALFFRAPNERVSHIPVTPLLLQEFANKGYWDVSYPEHKLPKRRYDLLINKLILALFIVYLFYMCTR